MGEPANEELTRSVGVELHISLDGRRGLAGQIYRQVRSAIMDGRLRPGQALPSSRELAMRLTVSRNTVSAAYDRLAAEGFLTARAGVQTYVSDRVRVDPVVGSPEAGADIQLRPVWDTQAQPADMSLTDPEYDFRPKLPDARSFPFATWRALMAGVFRESSVGAGAYGDPAGHADLRAAIARHVGVSRGIVTTADQVLVTNGSQQAVDLVSRVLLEPGDVVVVEEPGWWPPAALFETYGATVVRVPMDAEGMVVEALPAHARLVCVTPSHQFPLGVTMSPRRRLGLLSWARRAGAVVIEDDYDSEFVHTGRPVDPLYSLDRDGRVVYVGSFSRTLLATLRLAYCVAPPSLYPAIRKAKYLVDWHTPLVTQVALARFMGDGLFARHLRRMRRAYRDRHDRIIAAFGREFDDLAELVSSGAGLHVTARLRDGAADDHVVAARARRMGLGLRPLFDFGSAGAPHRGLILGFGAIPAERIDRGLCLLRRALAGAG